MTSGCLFRSPSYSLLITTAMFIEIAHAATEAAQAVKESSGGPLGTLGINLKLFIAQLINFAIILLVLWKWAWKPILKVLDDRAKRVEQSVRDAKRIEEEMKALDKKRNDFLREAEQKAQTVVVEAERMAAAHRVAESEKTKAEVSKLLERGKTELAHEKEQMVRAARAELAEVVVAATEKILTEKLDAKRDQELVKKILEKV